MKLSSNKLCFRFLAVIWVFVLVSACSAYPAQNVAKTGPLVVEFTAWWGDYTIIIAQENGLFEKYGVQVQPVYYETFSRALPDLAAGQIDGGLFTIGDTINVASRADVKVIAVSDNGRFNTVVSVPEITQIRDLAGRRVGVPIGTGYELLINELLASAGLQMSDVTLVNIDPENVPASLGATIDAGFIYEPFTTEAVAQGNNLLLKNTEFIGLYPDVIVFRSEIVKERGEEIRAFLKAWFEAVEFRRQNPSDAQQIIANYFRVKFNEVTPNNALEILTREDNYEILKPETDSNRSLHRTTRLNAEFLVRMGVLSNRPNSENLITPAYLP